MPTITVRGFVRTTSPLGLFACLWGGSLRLRTKTPSTTQACPEGQLSRKWLFLYDLFRPRGKTILKADRREQEVTVEILSNLLRLGKPKVTVSVLKRTSKLVGRAIDRTQIPVDYRTLPYPTRNYVTQYRSGLAAILTSFSEALGRATRLPIEWI